MRWGSPETPALVRYTADGGHTWTTLAISHRGGQMTLDAASLPGPGGSFQIIPADTDSPILLTAEPAP